MAPMTESELSSGLSERLGVGLSEGPAFSPWSFSGPEHNLQGCCRFFGSWRGAGASEPCPRLQRVRTSLRGTCPLHPTASRAEGHCGAMEGWPGA